MARIFQRAIAGIGAVAVIAGATTLGVAPPRANASTATRAPATEGARAPAAATQQSTQDSPKQVLDWMTLGQRVGQLIMIGTPADQASRGALDAIGKYHVGSVILTGRSHAGVAATKKVTKALQAATGTATVGAKLVVATDQEGGQVQVLQGPGFSNMPSALYQGTHYSLKQLRSHADTWGKQLADAGVNLDLAPVMDTVSKSFAPKNAPIGYFDREYGYTAHDVAMRATAFANGIRDAGLAASIKHFPGLGRVTGNTDVTSGVTDTVTTRQAGSVKAFGVGVDAGARLVMMSTAMYSKIDPGVPAAFSSTIMQGMLRGDLGFKGVIISDSLDGAAQVANWTPAQRALKFIGAGGDLILTTSSTTVKPMYQALVRKARNSAKFRKLVDTAALHVLQLKSSMGLLGNHCAFQDVAASNPHCGNIRWLKSQHITQPVGGKYHPTRPVTRGSMTAFLFRLTHPGKPSPTCSRKAFPDVSSSGVFCGDITWAADNGIALGYPNGAFEPDRGVSRGAMASFLHRTATQQRAPKCTKKPYADVPVDGQFCGAITWLKAHDITHGLGHGQGYGTTDVVTRQQMASFLHRLDEYMQ